MVGETVSFIVVIDADVKEFPALSLITAVIEMFPSL